MPEPEAAAEVTPTLSAQDLAELDAITAPAEAMTPLQLAADGGPSSHELSESPIAFEIEDLDVYYATHRAVRNVNLNIRERHVTALIGPSGCGKTTVLRCLNRMNDLVRTARVDGTIRFRGEDLYASDVDVTEVRRRIGMVFQKPNPFPKSIFDNIAYGPRLAGTPRKELPGVVERALTRAGLWDEVKDRLKKSALGLSGGQQQRLCIARAIAIEPEVILMDEPCSALDPLSTARIEDLMAEIKNDYTIVIVTHNMQQAARASDVTAFFTAEADEHGVRGGLLVETAATTDIFSNPSDPRTESYVTGRFG